MYGRQGNSNNTQPPPWLVRAEVTIRHGTPVTSESSQVPVSMSSTVTDSSGVRMIYRWNTSQSSSLPTTPIVTTSGPSLSSSSFGFQRGNIVFTSTPPPKPNYFTIPRSGSSGNDDSMSSRGRSVNVSDSGYNSGQFSPQSYSSLPSRRPSNSSSQQYNRRCKSTCSIVLSAVDAAGSSKEQSFSKIASSETIRHSYDNSWRHPSTHQHVFSRQQFSTLPEVCEECSEGTVSSVHDTHLCSSVQEKVTTKLTTVSKDASSQTTDIESYESSSTIVSKSKVRKKAATGLHPLDEQKKKKQESQSPTVSETTSVGPSADSERSDSSTRDDSAKRKSRTVHIDVYCTGSDDDENTDTTSENECDTPMTVFENPDVKVTHTQVASNILPRGFQDDKAFLKRATERRCDSFKHAPMRMPSIASSKGYDSDDVLSSLYPSQFSSYSALKDLDSAPWSAASSNAGIPFDYDSTIATSSKDTLSDIESLINNEVDLTPCDSFEYASSSDRERIRRMEEIWAKKESEGKQWRSPEVERKYLLQNRKMKEYLKKHEIGWSSGDSGEESDESGTVGWSFVSSEDNQRMFKKVPTMRRASKPITECTDRSASITEQELLKQKNLQQDHSDSTTRSDSIPHPYTFRNQIGSFGSKSPSPLPSKVPSRPVLPIISPYIRKTPQRKLVQSPESKRMQTPRLLRTSILSPASPNSTTSVPQQQCLPQVWRSETVVQVFLDFWVEYIEDDQLNPRLSTSYSASVPRRHSIHSGEHIRLVRAFIKTLHEFANSAIGDRSAMDELKRIILPSVQGKIYTFLRKAIYHWPLDSSFRLILEAWLSFIQPWRYFPGITYTKEGKAEEEERGKIHDAYRWMPFIAHNLLAYTAIFQQLLPRFMRTDLVAPKNALMLFRVTKVFSQPYLAKIICEIESHMDDVGLSRSRVSTNQWTSTVRQQILELEGPTYQYVLMFSTATISQVVCLLGTIKQAHLTATSLIEALEKKRKNRPFLLALWEFFNGEDYSSDDIGIEERRRVPVYLANAQQQLIDIFEIKVEDIPQVAIEADQEYHESILSTSFCHQSQMDSSLDTSKPGVFVPNQKDRQTCQYIEYMGDPELQPVRSNECALLVRNLYKLCTYINVKYRHKITKMYHRRGFFGSICRQILQSPTKVVKLPKRTQTGLSSGYEERIPPRLSLRPLANYSLLVIISLGTFIAWFTNYGVFTVLGFAFALWFVYIIIRATLEPWTRSNRNTFRANTTAFSMN